MLVRPDAAAVIFRRLLGHEAIEVCGLLCLTTRRRVICWHEVSRGSLDKTSVHPREIFKPAFMVNASAVIVGHNHPSGDPEPSGDDFEMTERLVRAGSLLGLDVIDHIIIGHNSFVSLKNHYPWPTTPRSWRELHVAARPAS
jgi:DNA repair protein RadC